jgi:hypothetical protein
MLVRVYSSLQETLAIVGTSKYSPSNASTCFLINGVNSTCVGLPIPKFSSRYLNYSESRLPL